MRIPILFVTYLLVVAESLATESDSSRFGYLSVHTGGFFAARPGFGDTYGSIVSFAVGGQVALPLSRQFQLIGAVTYISNTGSPLRTLSSFVPGSGYSGVGQAREGTIGLRQLLINAGTEIRFILSEQWTFFASGGLTFCRTVEALSSPPPGASDQTANGSISPLQEWIVGIFLGPTLEFKFADSPWALAIAATYNVSGVDLLEITGQKLGLSSTFAVRYYFPFNDRRKR